MAGCPICGRMMCDHSPAERGQTTETMMNQYNKEIQKSVPEKDKGLKKKVKK